MKKIVLLTLTALILAGCASQGKSSACSCAQTNSVMSTSFNEEHYIWENWIFPNNKTTGK